MTLEEIRMEIDAVDTQMKPLFLKRMECARHVAEAKVMTGGDVFVLERERAIIEKRGQDVTEAYDEYVMFLRHLMSVSRRFQYGILVGMQDRVLDDALQKAVLDENQPHAQVVVSFICKKAESNLDLFLNMIKLNGILLDKLELSTADGVQQVTMVLDGNLKEKAMRQLLCQLGKETTDFAITALR